MEFSEFILAHDGDELGRLALARERYAPDFPDFDLALTTLECRRKLRAKVPEWTAVPSLRFPLRLSAEQCSSTETARYKAAVALAALASAGTAGGAKMAENAPKCSCRVPFRLADLTGGLGVDSWAFAEVFEQVLYNELRPELAAAAQHNFKELGINNITVRNFALVPQSMEGRMEQSGKVIPGGASVSHILGDFRPDVIFLDPARRAADGRKVFRLEDCQPDVLQLRPELLAACPHVLLKLSPMADITLVCKQLSCVKEVHVVAAEGECKELLLLLERGYDNPHRRFVYENGSVLDLSGSWGGHRLQDVTPAAGMDGFEPGKVLFEPGKGLLKAGAFDWPCRYGLEKLGRHTHLYIGPEVPEGLAPFGNRFRILETLPLNNRTIKEIGKRYPQASVTARNIPLTSDELRRKLGVKDGGGVHLFGVHSDSHQANLLLVCTGA